MRKKPQYDELAEWAEVVEKRLDEIFHGEQYPTAMRMLAMNASTEIMKMRLLLQYPGNARAESTPFGITVVVEAER